jgi:hypothetical protein
MQFSQQPEVFPSLPDGEIYFKLVQPRNYGADLSVQLLAAHAFPQLTIVK